MRAWLNVVTWSLGANRVAAVAAEEGILPETLGRLHPRFKTPYLAFVGTGIVSTPLLVGGALLAKTQANIFWIAFRLSALALLLATCWCSRRSSCCESAAPINPGRTACRGATAPRPSRRGSAPSTSSAPRCSSRRRRRARRRSRRRWSWARRSVTVVAGRGRSPAGKRYRGRYDARANPPETADRRRIPCPKTSRVRARNPRTSSS